MKILDYFYTVGTDAKEDRVELIEDRSVAMVDYYIRMFKDRLASMDYKGRVAFLYAGGVGIHNAESRNYFGKFSPSIARSEGGVVIKNLQAYMMHKYIGMLGCKDDVVYANINSNTCASSLHSVHEAKGLLDRDEVDYVIVVTEEKTSFDTIRIFHEHNIDVKPGEGFACVVLAKEGAIEVKETKWAYIYSRNPFYVDAKGYSAVSCEADYVKGHKTGTAQNNEAEEAVFGETFGYKDKIGHCQGASGLIELCMVLDDDSVKGDVLCVASGLGGFYGSCLVNK